MYSENGLLIDLEDVREAVATADVFAVGFRQFPERLFVDTRWNDRHGPFVGVVEPVSSVQERLFWLGARRPSLGMPQRFLFFPWPHSIAFLQESGIWEQIARRVRASGHPQVDAMLEATLRQLKEKEHDANLAAIRGEGYHQIWPKIEQARPWNR